MGKKILLHICCGPCSITTIKSLLNQGFDVTGLYHNPNIHPLQEYLRRRGGVEQVADKLGIRVLYKDSEYDPKTYFRAVSQREDNRCFYCYSLRMERTASIAKRGGFDYFTTTLLYSKFQKHEDIAQLGRDLEKTKIQFWYEDFREGWKRGIDISKDWGIYRQQYCGCLYSEYERYHRELEG